MVSAQNVEKITITIPSELKERLAALKDELHLSVSAIYREAVMLYIAKKETESWEKGALIASAEYKNNPELKDWSEFAGDNYEL
jgi:post-segregation antitoxin (ccd killing protein)